ncbi:cytochrome P450 [Methylobacterium sp. 4-46]|uniref:cytochrome P450 n=1 Tax=unclassified Methylobacterium TaxID=2615210 RepID=UPI000152D1E7|nr:MULTISPECIES: cytochrome P450 [Methylobacterium]ACA18863.1 cytochrome P450 [Methylobacterium sp. 4-46]WFT78088.1 cytochrome P450 [Methylobacterium nodulans]
MTSGAVLERADLYAPPMPPLAERVDWLRLLSAFRRNTLDAFPGACLTEPTVTLRLPGGGRVVLLCVPEAVRHVLVAQGSDFARLPAGIRVLGPVAGRGLVTAEGEAWRRQRRVLAPAFTPRTVPLMARHIARATAACLRRLDAARGGPVDLHAEMQRLSLDIAASSMFSLEAGPYEARIRAMVSAYLGGLGRPRVSDFLVPPGWPTPAAPRRWLFRRRWRALIAELIAVRRAQVAGQGPRDLFDLLAEAHGEEPDGLLADEVGTMIVAGHETTASTLFWAATLLARAPAVQEALAAEARGLDLGEAGAAAALPRLALARAVVQEALRLYPPAYMIARRAVRDGAVCGAAIPAGTTVMIPTWVMHRNPRWWPRADAFDPERFLRPGEEPDRFVYLPFGAGPQVCIGAQLALAEATLALAGLARRFALSLDGARPILPVATVTVRPDHAPPFRLARR